MKLQQNCSATYKVDNTVNQGNCNQQHETVETVAAYTKLMTLKTAEGNCLMTLKTVETVAAHTKLMTLKTAEAVILLRTAETVIL